MRTKSTTILLLCLAEGARAGDGTVFDPPSAFAGARTSPADAGVTIEGSLTSFGQGGLGLDDEQGLEVFYDLAVTPWLRVTAGVQWIDPATPNADDAINAALRTQMRL